MGNTTTLWGLFIFAINDKISFDACIANREGVSLIICILALLLLCSSQCTLETVVALLFLPNGMTFFSLHHASQFICNRIEGGSIYMLNGIE